LSPSILDRLIDYDRDDDAPADTTEDTTLEGTEAPFESHFIHTQRFDAAFLCKAVERDLNNLLRTLRTQVDALPPHLAELATSVYCYGLPDRTSFGFTAEVTERVADDVRAVVALFEPRLHNIRVALESDPRDPGLVHFVISGRVRARPAPQVIHFDARLSPAAKTFTVKERSSQAASEDLFEYYLSASAAEGGPVDAR
jgi:type VI secretion system lysozyme-like protein